MARGAGHRLLAVAGGAALAATLSSAPASSSVAPPQGLIRVNQQGYLPHEAKRATLMAPQAISNGTFVVTDRSGQVVLHGRVPSGSRDPGTAGSPTSTVSTSAGSGS